jgi:hypothetical protein
LTSSPIAIERPAADFADWAELLALINAAFAYMDGVSTRPSAKTLTPDGLQAKSAQKKICFVARCGGRLVGCISRTNAGPCLYIGKLGGFAKTIK